jgi:hypothetical protein
MSRYRIRVNDDDESGPSSLLLLAAGALAGFAAGVYLSQRFGGVAGVTARLRSKLRASAHKEDESEEEEYEEEERGVDEEVFVSANEELEERVLSAFSNDPTLRERAVDIGAVAEHTIELTGHVFTATEADHAAIIARGVPGVEAVVNRLHVRHDEQAEDTASESGDADDEDETPDGEWEADAADVDRLDTEERRPTYYEQAPSQEPGEAGMHPNRPIEQRDSDASTRRGAAPPGPSA